VPAVKVNLAKLVADVGAAFLFGTLPTISVDGDDTTRGPQETYLDDVFAANNAPLTFLKLATNGATMGDPYIKLLERSPLTRGLPRLLVLNPQTVTMFCEPDDVDDVFAYRIEYRDVDRRTGKPLNVRQEHMREGERWTITDYEERNGRWVEVGRVPWPYPFAAILHCQNLPQPNECYGRADLDELLLDTNETINYTWTNLLKIMAFHAHPRTVFIKSGPGSSADSGPDKAVILTEGSSVELLQPAAVDESSINVYLRLKEALHAVSETPEIATGKLDSVGALSGVALKILYGPIVGKTERKRLTYGPMLVDLCKRLLAIGGVAEYGSAAPRLTWPELVPSDPLAERQALQIDVDSFDVSAQTAQNKLGYDPEQEAKRKAKENAAAVAQAQAMAPPQQQGQPFGG